ncbi:preprotein translocase subunit SecE [Actinomyces minihominis]|uniref:preprotein translocase subunit SecE n=1 Tax=Actinomyces minihominis TaxID=2002838 RepID=UPI000C06E5E3|nr:preprotein translocase subunit SecE [Actinomyces minihominis]
MSQTTSLPGDGELLPEANLNGAAAPKDRTKSGATRKRDDRPAESKPNIFQRIALFVRQIVAEMKKVTYPSKEELWTYFLVVIVFVALMMLFTGLVDLGSKELSKLVFG